MRKFRKVERLEELQDKIITEARKSHSSYGEMAAISAKILKTYFRKTLTEQIPHEILNQLYKADKKTLRILQKKNELRSK